MSMVRRQSFVHPELCLTGSLYQGALQFAGLSVNEIPSTGQLGGLLQNSCCKAPDLRIGKRVMNE